MTGLIIEGGIYFLLLFTPFAFGGVEMWARGVLQIVAGLVVAAWAWDRIGAHGRAAKRPPNTPTRILWASIGLFVLLCSLQLAPLPPEWLKRISPATHDLYSRTLPGYAQGEDFDASSLTSWLLGQARDRIPPAAGAEAAADITVLDLSGSRYPVRAFSWRALSIYPFDTCQRLSLLLCYIGLFTVVASHFRERERIDRLLAVAVFSALALSLFGIIQQITWNGKLYWVREGSYAAVFGSFVNRNNYAAFAGTLLPVALCMALAALRHVEEGRRGSLPRLLLWGFAVVVIAGGIFYSLSRGGILAALLSLGIVAMFVIYYGRGARDLAVLGAVGLGAAGFLFWIGPEKVIERVGTLAEGQSIPSLESRLGAWERSLRLIASHPLVGTGLGTFRFAIKRFAPPGEGWWTEAHNEYLELVCDTGLAGAAIFLVGLVAYLTRVARPARFRDRSERYSYIGVLAGILGLLFHSVASSNLQMPANGLLMVVLGAALISLVEGRHRRGRFHGAPRGPEPAWATAAGESAAKVEAP